MFAERVKINGDAKGRADFVLPTIAFADIAVIVKDSLEGGGGSVELEGLINFAGLGD